MAAGPQATDEIKEALRQEFGLDRPLPLQYITYVGNLFRGDWGESLYSRRAVLADLRTFFPATLELTLVAVIIGALLGIPAGVVSAYFHNRLPDHITRVIALFFVSFPAFWLAMIFQMALGRELGWFPIGKRFDVRVATPEGFTGLLLVDSLLQLDFEAFYMALRHIVTPASGALIWLTGEHHTHYPCQYSRCTGARLCADSSRAKGLGRMAVHGPSRAAQRGQRYRHYGFTGVWLADGGCRSGRDDF